MVAIFRKKILIFFLRIAEKKLTQESAHQLVSSALAEAGYAWKETNGQLEYAQKEGSPSPIKSVVITHDPAKNVFQATAIKNTGEKPLGESADLRTLKSRVEEYAINMAIKTAIERSLANESLSKNEKMVLPVPSSNGDGMDMW